MAKLIAQVPTAVVVDGERKIFQPGEELPEINPHDTAALVDMGAAKDSEVEAAKDKSAARELAAAKAEFNAAREKIEAEQASIAAAPNAGDGAGAGSDPNANANANANDGAGAGAVPVPVPVPSRGPRGSKKS